MATEKHVISDGPSKWDFFLSATDGDDVRVNRRVVSFTLDCGYNRVMDAKNILIDGFEREDGSGENWLFVGQYLYPFTSARKIKGYYSTRTRRGWFEFVN